MKTTGEAEGGKRQARGLVDMLQYQEKSVVSRMLVKNAGGSVTLFAFDAGEGLSEHTAPFDALVIGVDGNADISIGGEAHVVGAGDALLLPMNVPHAVSPVGPFKMLLIMIRGDKAA